MISGQSSARAEMCFADGRDSGRLCLLDLARAIALSQMVVFHFARDLELFGLIASGTTLTGGWALYARGIAASFLFLSGISLVLANEHGFRSRAWFRRFLLIAGAACLISLVTYAAIPSRFIYFGILHAIAAASLLGLPFLFLPAWVSAVAAVLVLIADASVGRDVFTAPWLAWTGLGAQVRASLDFIPLVPWFASFLFGIAFARTIHLRRLEPAWPQWFPVYAVSWLGRNSLAIYLLHQPILLALVWTTMKIAS